MTAQRGDFDVPPVERDRAARLAAPDLSPAEAATLARIEAAPWADESAVERGGRAIFERHETTIPEHSRMSWDGAACCGRARPAPGRDTAGRPTAQNQRARCRSCASA